MSDYLSVPQVAEELGLSTATVRAYVTAGRLRAFKLGTGGRTSPVRIRRIDLEAFVDAGAL